MLRAFCHRLFFKTLGWKEEVTVPRHDKCIICVAPHTSNWDFIMAEIYYYAIGRRAGFLMKKEWFFWPLGLLFKRLGGVPVTRNRRTSLTDQLAEKAQSADRFELAVTPEGTRSLTTQWKRGFYFIALKAELPIMLFAIDYKTKTISCKKTIMPSGDVEADMRVIMDYYKDFHGKHPEKFAIEPLDNVANQVKS